ncbi:penicillin-binding protein 1A [Candidatus Magnetomoraceae bacterium gMMP-15]
MKDLKNFPKLKKIKKNKKTTNVKPKKGMLKFFIKIFLCISLSLIILSLLTLLGIYLHFSHDLPKISSLSDYNPPIITNVYSDDEKTIIAEFFKERRIVVPVKKMPPLLLNAFVSAEDDRFYEHPGIDWVSIVRAFFRNLEAGTIVQGGSTITQQVTKSFLLSPEKKYARKIREAILAYKIDNKLSKEEILHLYLNQIYLGHGAYGVEAAAQNYFDKSVNELNLAECAMLAGLPQAPTRYSPYHSFDKAKARQEYVLRQMLEEGYINKKEAKKARETPLKIKARRNLYIEKVPYYTETVRSYVEKKYGQEMLYNEGLQIYTAINTDMQKIGRSEIEKGLRTIDKRRGYRGPLKHLKKDRINSFLQSLQEKTLLKKNRIVKGVVVKIKKKNVTVNMGKSKGIITLKNMKWARKPNPRRYPYYIKDPKKALKTGDVILVKLNDKQKNSDLWNLSLEQTPDVQAALVCIEAKTGKVKTMLGGRNFKESQFNRAIQSRRQPGSAFKPIVYAAALDREASFILTNNSLEKLKTEVPAHIFAKLQTLKKQEFPGKTNFINILEAEVGKEQLIPYKWLILQHTKKLEKQYTPASVIIDSAIVYRDAERHFTWKPKNYEKKFYGPTTLRDALTLSRNVVTIKILQDIGVNYVIDYARKLGITSNFNQDLSIALGSSGISLLEMVRAYAVFDNHGYLVKPIFVTKIIDRYGNIIEENVPIRKRVIEKSTAYCMTSLLQSVVKQGTAKKIKELKRPVVGKTGTTNNQFDAWFIGYTPGYVTGVWVGLDQEGSLGRTETGARAAAPIWLEFMKKFLADKPIKTFLAPEGIVFAKIDTDTGLLAIPESKNTIFECFKEGTVPTEYTPKPDSITDMSDFYKENM